MSFAVLTFTLAGYIEMVSSPPPPPCRPPETELYLPTFLIPGLDRCLGPVVISTAVKVPQRAVGEVSRAGPGPLSTACRLGACDRVSSWPPSLIAATTWASMPERRCHSCVCSGPIRSKSAVVGIRTDRLLGRSRATAPRVMMTNRIRTSSRSSRGRNESRRRATGRG